MVSYIKNMSEIIKSYADLDFHKNIGALIKNQSVNKQDIRDVVNRLIDWDSIRGMLDIGCGYGWFEEKIEKHLDFICGIDCLSENETDFLKKANMVADKADFINLLLPAPINLPSDSFDLVVSAYSLYFFPGAIPEVKRVLHRGGTFVVITHSEYMLEEGERFFDFANLRKVIKGFAAENGESILKEHFSDIIAIDYRNALLFSKQHREELANYIDFKKEFIAKDVDPAVVRKKMLEELDQKGNVRFNKNDRVFIVKK